MRRAALLACFVLAACAAGSGEKSEPAGDGMRIGAITAGTMRNAQKQIVNPRTEFSGDDRLLLFNVEFLDVTETADINVYWFIEDDTGPFSKMTYQASPENTAGLFEIESTDRDWPDGTYTMLVQIGEGKDTEPKTFQYEIEP